MTIRNALPSLWRGDRTQMSPFRDMNRFQRNMDRMFDEFLADTLPSLVRPTRNLLTLEDEFTPLCDLVESDSHYLVSFDLPGVKKDEIKVEVRGQQLTVSGERKKEHHEEGKERISQERFHGSFIRTFILPTHVEGDKAEAKFENGVLEISIPKAEVIVGKQIPIKEGKLLPHEKEVKLEKSGKAA